MKKCLLVLAVLLCIPSATWGQEATANPLPESDWTTVLNSEIAGGPPELMLNRYLLKQIADAEQKINATSQTLDTPEKLQAWQQKLRKHFLESLGDFPERAPLNARSTGVVDRGNYRVEKVLFESRPHHYVTAALFLPNEKKFPPPYPGVLVPCGHSQTGKAINFYQRGGVLAACNGLAALVYDPIDQGERMQQVDEQGKFAHFGVGGHNKIGVSAQLLGWNTATFRIWDGMRAVDYLTSRSDIDPKRIGCMGNSGGGTLTTYLTALEPRIIAASPNCYITTLSRVCSTIGPQDAEQNIFGQMAFGMDHADMLLMRAPTPIRIGAAQQDFFPIQGAREAFTRSHDVMAKLGFENHITLTEDVGQHGWSEPLRMASTQWMSKWLRKVEEIEQPTLEDMGIPDAAIQVTERGQTMLIPGARSAYDIMRDELAILEKARQPKTAIELQQAVRRRAGIRPLQAIPAAQVAERVKISRDWGTIRKLTWEVTPSVLLPGLVLEPSKPQGEPIVFLHGLGKSAAAAELEALAKSRRVVLAVDLSGLGETQGCKQPFYGSNAKDEPDSVMAYLLGRSMAGIRAEDLLACTRWFAEERKCKAVELHAVSWAVTPALHAAVSEPSLFSGVHISDSPPAWSKVIQTADRHRFSDIVHGALRDYDLPDLAKAVSATQNN